MRRKWEENEGPGIDTPRRNRKHIILDHVRLRLVKGQQDEGLVVVHAWVGEQGEEPQIRRRRSRWWCRVSLLEAIKFIGRHVLMVSRPRDVLFLEQVDMGGDVGRDVVHVVVVHPEEVPADRCDV
jgi:hypothetical protein